MPIKKQPYAFHDVCRSFVLREMTDAIEFKEARRTPTSLREKRGSETAP
jgi:hypothetical protein